MNTPAGNIALASPPEVAPFMKCADEGWLDEE
jgi:hypothetical protein